MKRKLTMKEKGFVKDITDKSNQETFGNGTQSILNNYNVKNDNVASSIAYEKLRKPEIVEAIEKKILKKEDIQNNLATFTEKIQSAIKTIDVDNVPLLREYREYNMAHAKINGDLVERIQSINLNIDRDKDLSSLPVELLQDEIMKRMQDVNT